MDIKAHTNRDPRPSAGGRSSRLFGVGTGPIMVYGREGDVIPPYYVPNWQAITPGKDILPTKWAQAPKHGLPDHQIQAPTRGPQYPSIWLV